jgi:hypothetical protein
MLWAGHVPDLCVRHGAPAAARMSFYRGMVQHWPFCAECLRSRRISRLLAVAALLLPFVVMIAGGAVFWDDPDSARMDTFIDVTWVLFPAGIITCSILLHRYVAPSGLAKASLVDSTMFLVMQGAHPEFVAHADALFRATQGTYPPGQPVLPAAEGEIHF